MKRAARAVAPGALLAALLAFALSCGTSAAGGSRATSRPPPSPPGLDHDGARALAAAGERTDLSKHGLPLTIHLPECAKVVEPEEKTAEDAHDLLLLCDLSDTDAMDGRQAFAIQLGPAKGKIGKKEISEDPAFVRFTKVEPPLLEFESKLFGEVRRDFMVRASRGGTEYACYPVAGTTDERLFAAEREACLSIAATKSPASDARPGAAK